MALDNVAFDQRSVASIEFFRHAVLVLEVREAFAKYNFLFDFEAVLFEMAHPAITTVSRRRLIYSDRRCGSLGLRITHSRQQRQAQINQTWPQVLTIDSYTMASGNVANLANGLYSGKRMP